MRRISIFTLTLLAIVACTREKAYDAAGTFESETITVSARGSGEILSLDVKEGDSVIEGQVLGVVDTMSLYLQKLQLQKQVQTVRSGRPDVEKQVAGIRAQLAQAQREKTRIEGLLADGAATQKSLDDVTAQITVLERQLDASLSTLRSSVATVDGNSSAIEIQIAQIENQLEKCRIVAPASGTILASYAHTGEMAVAGKALLKVADLDNVFLRAYFTSEQLATIGLGQTVKVFADFGGDSRIEYPGTITWIASESEFTPKSIQTRSSRANLVYAVKIAVKNDGRIKLGLYGEVVL